MTLQKRSLAFRQMAIVFLLSLTLLAGCVEKEVVVTEEITPPSIEAQEERLRALELKMVPVLKLLGKAYQECGEVEKAVETYEKVVLLKPDDTDALSHLASAYFQAGSPDKAKAIYARLVELEPRKKRYYVQQLWQGAPSESDLVRPLSPKMLAQCWGVDGKPTEEVAKAQEQLGMPELLATADVDGDGKQEILASTSSDWLIWVSCTGNLIQKQHIGSKIECLLTEDLEGDGHPEILVAGSGLKIFDADGTVRWQYGRERITDIATGDFDGDGEVEIAIIGRVLRVLDAKKGEIEWEKNLSGEGLATGDLDGDGRPELVISSRPKLFVLSSDVELRWAVEKGHELNRGWAKLFLVEDLNGDGKQEVITVENTRPGARPFTYVRAFDSEGVQMWSQSGPSGVRAIASGDINGDGRQDVGIGSTNWDVQVIDADGALLADLPAGSWVFAVSFADVDADGKEEIIIGSQGKSCFVYASDVDGNLLWRYFTGYEVRALLAKDLDGDGEVEIVVAADDLILLDGQGKLRWKLVLGGDAELLIGDIDGDGKVESVRGSSILAAYGPKGKPKWALDIAYVWSLAGGDVDGDGKNEIAVGCYDNTVYLIGPEGRLRWQRQLEWIRGKVSMVKSDDDRGMDIIVSDASYTYRFDKTGHLIGKWRKQ